MEIYMYILDAFSLSCTKCKVKKGKQKQTKWKTEKQEQKKQRNCICIAFVCYIWSYRAAGSENSCARNYAHAGRVTADKYHGHFQFL